MSVPAIPPSSGWAWAKLRVLRAPYGRSVTRAQRFLSPQRWGLQSPWFKPALCFSPFLEYFLFKRTTGRGTLRRGPSGGHSAWKPGYFCSGAPSSHTTLAAPPSPAVRAQRTMPQPQGGVGRCWRGRTSASSPQPLARCSGTAPCVRAWEAGFLPRWQSYQILPYFGNSMGNESTQESGLASERKVNITKRKSLPVLETMRSQE